MPSLFDPVLNGTQPAFAKPMLFRDRLAFGGMGPVMALIPPGRFLMGSPPGELEREKHEGPLHEVVIAKPFSMGRYAVTFAEFDAFTRATRQPAVPDLGFGRGRVPVIEVSWLDAKAYCTWLSAQSGHRYRLPSEAEWEYACRAGTQTPFYLGETLSTDQANFQGMWVYGQGQIGQFRGLPLPVNRFAANDFGLLQMHGNVSEWCEDNWHQNYRGAPANGRPWLKNSRDRVLRGGNFNDPPGMSRSASRRCFKQDRSWCYFGFRVVRELYCSS